MTQLGPILTNALKYWEVRRLPYNLVLAGIVGYALWIRPFLITRENLAYGFVLAVLANVCYCAAYLVDVPVQFSEFRPGWLEHRWMLWVLGMVVGAVLTWLACFL